MKRKFFHSMICAAFILSLSNLFSNAGAYTVNESNRTITVTPLASPADTTRDLRNAINYLTNRSDKQNQWTWRFNPGKYILDQQLPAAGLDNVAMVSDPNNPATIQKVSNWSSSTGEHIFYIRNSQNIILSGFNFYGLTTFQNNANPVWPDQGLFFGSTRNVTVENNKFYNFGNAAIRFTTYEKDPVLGVNSFGSRIRNNTFDNIYQIATTSNDPTAQRGGTADFMVENNTFTNLRGSVKAASRTPGCTDVRFRGNTIRGGNHYGFEIASCTNIEISNNIIENIDAVAINIYTNANAPKGFAWGDNTVISNNTIRNVNRAIRFSPNAYPDGYKYAPKNLRIEGNKLNTVTEVSKDIPAISVINGGVNGIQILNNTFEKITSKNYIATHPSSTNVTLLGNMVDNLAFGPQPEVPIVPAIEEPVQTTPTTSKPLTPSNSTSVMSGPNVLVGWVDNAANETSQEVWISSNDVQYNLLTKLGANSTSYTHALNTADAGKTFYYKIRAMNNSGASPFSRSTKIVIPVTSAPSAIPAAPTNLTGQLQGSNTIVLNWVDNAVNETSQEIWVSPNDVQYTRLVSLAPGITTYTHNFSAKPASNVYFYKIRAMNASGASVFGRATRVNL